jgi:hypothetical protein
VAKKTKTYVGDIPFDIWGNQLHYPEGGYLTELEPKNWNGEDILLQREYDGPLIPLRAFSHEVYKLELYDKPRKGRWGDEAKYIGQINPGVIWVENHLMTTTLVYDCYSRGRSAAYFRFRDKFTDRQFTVFLKDFEEGFAHNMVKGELTGTFAFCKRGSNYGTMLVKI